MKIMFKLMSGFFLLVLVFSISGAIVISNMDILESVNEDVSTDFAISQYAMNYERGARKMQAGAYLYAQDSQVAGTQLMEEGKADMLQNREKLEQVLTDQVLIKELEDIEQLENLSLEAARQVVEKVNNPGDGEQQRQLTSDLNVIGSRVDVMNIKLDTFVNTTRKDMESSMNRAVAREKQTTYIVLFAVALSALIALIISFVSARMITRPLEHLIDIANSASKGETDRDVNVSSSDEIGILAESFKRMINAFKIMEEMVKDREET